MGLIKMDITLERILSLLPQKPDGKFIHGSKKDFAESLNLPHNIIAEWIRGKNKGYFNYLYEIAAKYNVSVEWLKGETDEKNPPPVLAEEEIRLLLGRLNREQLLEIIAKATDELRGR